VIPAVFAVLVTTFEVIAAVMLETRVLAPSIIAAGLDDAPGEKACADHH
jgi:hypothetical protein